MRSKIRFMALVMAQAVLVVLAGCNQQKTTGEKPGETPASEAGPASQAEVAAPAPADTPLACDYPVAHDETADRLLAKYGDDAVVGKLQAPDATIVEGVILWRGYSKQRIEVTFWDKAMTHIRAVRLGQEATAWKGPEGLHYGSSLADVATANGASFGLTRYNPEDGGYLSDFEGRLAHLDGGCALSVRLRPEYAKRNDVPYSSQDDDGLASDDDRLKDLGLTVTRMEITWPKP